ncbi:glycosyl transferase family 90 [Mucilaginibacter sabulilitoris]|uniref:Glycosyl transferase family 90 n=1 Tax=Mucilaginibacter sabulilitoris TaxID=1173583 RepID=A0ABZ0TU08_9SPHI|nr:glycosyl transferase family 90 [Mucilaginibacter sabulilitoris]WPU96596.1 glycosyl transferase family 90 [Mucilaginibacter sabulilitoris]
MAFKKISSEIKRSKIPYYAKNILRQIIPSVFYQSLLNKKLSAINNYNKTDVINRVNYYNRLEKFTSVGPNAIELQNMQIFKSPKAYNFDTFEFTRYFKKHLKANFLFGDVTYNPDVPSIQKSRPITGDNANAVLLKLDKKRHFVFINDDKKFADKKNMLIGRGTMSQPHRITFMEKYFNSQLCDLGQVNKTGGNTAWFKPKISITEHLGYKFILSLEGNDVATNLKWIMSSNSIAVMPKPKYETWFMEGLLIPDYHYILIKDDYSDLEEKLCYYIDHDAEALDIVNNANQFVKQFLNKKQEGLISLMVLQKYFYCTGQIDHIS